MKLYKNQRVTLRYNAHRYDGVPRRFVNKVGTILEICDVYSVRVHMDGDVGYWYVAPENLKRVIPVGEQLMLWKED